MSQFKELIDPGKLEDTVLMAKDVVSVQGCLVRKHVDSYSPDSIQHAPFTLFPSPVPKRCFIEALAIQKEVQLMLHNIAHDYEFLKESLESVIKVDEFTRNIWNIFETVTKENIVKPVSLAMIRSDYMIDSKIRNCNTICKNVQSMQTQPSTILDTRSINIHDVKSNASSSKTVSHKTISSYNNNTNNDANSNDDNNNNASSNNNNNVAISNENNSNNANNNSSNNINTDSNSADHNNDDQDPKLVENFMESYESYPCDVALKQVEVNTMSASFPGLAQNLHKYHRFIISKGHSPECHDKVPKNEAAVCFAQGLVTAWKSYKNERAVILFLVFEVERNIYDQRKLEILISKNHPRVRVIRRSLEYMHRHAYMNEKDRKLVVDNLEVAVVYQRSCYKPQDFSGGASLWKCRMMMERSQAIMCPSAGYHLAGTKKVQQVLSKPGMLERFVKDSKMRERIRSTFASQYELDRNPAGDKALQMAIENPNNFVVKPQREGGGNNTYGQDIVDLLTSIRNSDERLSFILMERISPMVVYNFPVIANETSLPTPCHSTTDVQCNTTPQPQSRQPQLPLASSASSSSSSSSSSASSEDVLKQQKVKLTEMVSELGVYGVLVGSKHKIIMNEQCGYLLRTKNADTNEGGVATGYSVLDSPYLLD